MRNFILISVLAILSSPVVLASDHIAAPESNSVTTKYPRGYKPPYWVERKPKQDEKREVSAGWKDADGVKAKGEDKSDSHKYDSKGEHAPKDLAGNRKANGRTQLSGDDGQSKGDGQSERNGQDIRQGKAGKQDVSARYA